MRWGLVLRDPFARRLLCKLVFCLAAVAAVALASPASTVQAGPLQLNKVRNWAYQLQNIDPLQIQDSPFDLVVVDYGFSKDSAATYPREVIDLMRTKPDGGRRFVFAYLSIGEAERYRYYWDDNWYAKLPEWIDTENTDWPGNFLVKFWHPEWRALIYGSPRAYLDRIVDAGFDGVYLDGIDKFEQWTSRRPSAAADMVTLIAELGAYARGKRSGFLVIPQNGDKLIRDPRLLRAIDGISREDLLYGELALGERNAITSIAEAVARLQIVQAAGKPVLVVEYPRGIELSSSIMDEIEKFGFVGYVTNRELNHLTAPLIGTADQSEGPWGPGGAPPIPYLPPGAGMQPAAHLPAGTTGHR